MTFELFDQPGCLGEPLFISGPHDIVFDPNTPNPLDPEPVTVESKPFIPNRRGEYLWRVQYSGGGPPDNPFQAFTTPCGGRKPPGDPHEMTVVSMMLPVFEPRPTVVSRLGQFIVDAVAVIRPPEESIATGTVTFDLFGPDDPKGSGPPLMTTADVELTTTDPPTARSRIFRPTKPGTYLWMFRYSGDENYVGMNGHGGTSVVSTHVPEETMSVAEIGTPVRHERDATFRGRVTYAEVVDLLSLPGEVADD
ncbi:MAG: hypothetical protein ACR2KK_08890 [Acidimicrobiales bacterium]